MYELVEDIVFDPKIHLAYDGTVTKITMEELKLPNTPTSSPVAASLPFSLLSHEGVRAYRRALFNPRIIDNCAVCPRPGTLVMRGAGKMSKFIHDFWTHEETMKIISDVVNIPLSIIMPLEIGHTNIQAKGSNLEEMKAALRTEPTLEKVPITEEEKNYNPLDENSIIPWHHDSYPYVCVLMISETEGMVGGETYIKAGDGEISKVEGPMIGHACILQGGEVEHMAARGFGVAERITTITSYRPNVPQVYDSSYTSNIRAYSNLDILYPEWALYRLEKMKEEIEAMQFKIRSSGAVNTDDFENFRRDQTEYLLRSTAQMVPVDFHRKIIARHGSEVYNSSPKLWKRVQQLPELAMLSTSEKSLSWMPESPFWDAYRKSLKAVQAGEALESEQGRFIWPNTRPYYMGDELLRQGVKEYFLDWLDQTGLHAAYLNHQTAIPVA